MFLKSTAPFAHTLFTTKMLPCARFSNKIKDSIENLFKSEPKIIVQDAVQAQSALIEGYDKGLNNFISKYFKIHIGSISQQALEYS